MEESLETFQALDPVAYLSKFTKANTRPDSRPHHITRPTNLQPTILSLNSHGSSLTTIGNTQVITGITLQVGTPSPSTPLSGEINVTTHFSPLCGGQYNIGGRIAHDEYGQKSSSANAYADPQSIESFVKRTVVDSCMVDLDQLGILEGKAAWKIDVSCVLVNHDGNVVDAFLLGVVMALKDLRLPRVMLEKVDGEEVVRFVDGDDAGNDVAHDVDADADMGVKDPTRTNRTGKKLVFRKMCVPLTIGSFQGKMLVDPSLEEESLCDGMITVVVDAMSLNRPKDEHGGVLTGDILNLSKSGGGVLSSMEEIAACAQLAFGRAKELEQILLI
jgi:exosome complex RNA-binding protein Rrp42 (RNase PH superfamily)